MNIKIHNYTYVFLLISFFSGYFEYIYLLLLIIFVHECGHIIFGYLVGINYSKIIIFPFGGISLYDEELNLDIKKELFILLGGIIFQLIFLLLVSYMYHLNIISLYNYSIFKKINYLLISFNFMPILPLDGGRLFNIVMDYIFPYRLSNIISIIISVMFIVYFVLYEKTLFSFLLSLFLFKNIIVEIKNVNYKYNLFILERYLNDYKFNKIKIVKNIKYLKRNNKHIIDNKFESDVLHKLFDR